MLEIGAAGWWARSFEVVHQQSPKSRADDDMTAQHVSILEKFAAKAIRLGADQLEVEYKDGYEELSAIAGDFGFGIEATTTLTVLSGCNPPGHRRLPFSACDLLCHARGLAYRKSGSSRGPG